MPPYPQVRVLGACFSPHDPWRGTAIPHRCSHNRNREIRGQVFSQPLMGRHFEAWWSWPSSRAIGRPLSGRAGAGVCPPIVYAQGAWPGCEPVWEAHELAPRRSLHSRPLGRKLGPVCVRPEVPFGGLGCARITWLMAINRVDAAGCRFAGARVKPREPAEHGPAEGETPARRDGPQEQTAELWVVL